MKTPPCRRLHNRGTPRFALPWKIFAVRLLNTFATSLLLIAATALTAFADDEPAKETVKGVGTVIEVKKEELKKEPQQKEPADRLNLEILIAPLQILFGGGGGGGAMPAPVGLNVNVAEAQNDALTKQFLVQFGPFLTEELGFIRLVCSDLSKEQRPKIKAAGQAGLKLAAKEMANFQNRRNQGIGIQAKAQPEPRKMVREAVEKALNETLTAEQMVRYLREETVRKEQRKRAAILCVVSRLDGCLSLSADQREKIIDAISSHWEDKWEQWLMINVYGDQYFPEMPEQYVAPFLNPDQKSFWKGLQKINLGEWWGNNGQNPPSDGWWGDEPDAADQANRQPAFHLIIEEQEAIGILVESCR